MKFLLSTKSIYLSLSILLFLLAALLSFGMTQEKNQDIEKQRNLAQQEAQRASQYISSKLQKLKSIAISVKEEFNANDLTTSTAIEEMILKKMMENPDIYGVNVSYLPFKFDPNRRLYSPYVKREFNKVKLVWLEDSYDYTQAKQKWFNRAVEEGDTWQEPFYGEVSRSMLAMYSFPIYGKGKNAGTLIAIGSINYTLDSMREFIASLKLGKNGYGVILSKDGNVISHPNDRLVSKQTNLATVAKEKSNEEMTRLANSIASNKRGAMAFIEKATQRNAWVFHEPIKNLQWTFLSVIFEDKSNAMAQKIHTQSVVVSLLVLFGIMFTLAYIRHIFKLSPWTFVTFVSFFILLEIVVLWNIAIDEVAHKHESTVISDYAGLQKWKDEQRSYAESNHKKVPSFIPTGIFIENVIQKNAHDIAISGQIWQEYKKDDSKLSRGVEFMEITETLSEEFMPIYKKVYADKEVVGWKFRILLREEYWPLRFPFDSRNIHIRLRHPDFLSGVRLIPDLSSYNTLAPTSLPGIDDYMHIPGWETVTSHFEFLQHDYHTSFGMSGKDKLSYIEDFSFNFKIHREFLGPFISHLIPTLVISVMLFALLLMTRDDKKNEKNMIGFSAMQILSSSGGLFFVLIISHNNLRSTSEIPKVIYLENFYFLLYFAIVFIAINALLFITNKKIAFIHYRENLLPKLLYWPVLLGTSLIVTLNYFS